jgi:alpha,alpha-trehalose phosphorylase
MDMIGSRDADRLTVVTRPEPGQRLRLVKLLAHGWSAQRSRPASAARSWSCMAGARSTGWNGLVNEQRAFVNHFWSRADVEIDGDPQVPGGPFTEGEECSGYGPLGRPRSTSTPTSQPQ